MKSDQLFGKHQFATGESKTLRIDDFHLKISRVKEGWYMSILKENESAPGMENEEYYQTGKSNTLVIAPALPDKPIVFKGSKLKISPNQKFTFFLKIPIYAQMYYSKQQEENLFAEIPCKRLSDTWFGDPDSGEPAFALKNEYDLHFENIKNSETEAICPVTVFNDSPQTLELQRLIIRVENLTLYKNDDKIVTSHVQVEYKGQNVMSSAEYRYSKAFDGDKQEVITKPRNVSGKNLLKINFHFIKTINRTE